jgi:hypothetical protein
MQIVNALLSAAFLILVAAAAAVTGSMVLLGLFDYALGKKKASEPGPAGQAEEKSTDEAGNDAALQLEEELHAEQMRKFGTR